MSRIEQALEKAAHLRNAQVGNVAVKEVEGKHSEQAAVHHPLPPVIPAGEPLPQIDNPFVSTLSDPHSPVSEEYRKLKSVLASFARQDGFKNVIMVTSSVSNEGKSLTSLNLAITLAQEFDHTVLLIDADLRKPSIQGYLGMKPTKGLSEYLAGGVELSELLVKTGIGRLTLLPAGTPVKNPVEFFSSQKMKDFVKEIKNRYPDRFIIIDTPPILPFAETRSLGAIVDGVVLVAREGQATPESITEAIKAVDSAKLIGAVYNDATMASMNGHYHYYYYGYGYGHKGISDSHARKQDKSGGSSEGKEQSAGRGGRLKALFGKGKRKNGEATNV
ncbi:MAG: XrtA-associated tyrosine autokinase [Geobacteraceae bacterium]|nr:XrtA-associated tyrosine autokinase [Geobacteraceae bacterium]